MWPLLPIAVAMFCMSALVYYHVWEGGSAEAQSVLQSVVVAIYGAIGFVPAFLLCALTLVWSSIWFLGGALEEPRVRVAKVAACTVSLAIWINLRGAGEPAGPHTGAFGDSIATRLVEAIGFVPATLLLAPLTLVLFLLATDFLFYRHFDELWVPRERKASTRQSVQDDGGVGNDDAEILKSLAQAEEAERAAEAAAAAAAAAAAGEMRSSWRERRRRLREAVDEVAPAVESVSHSAEAQVEESASPAVATEDASAAEAPAAEAPSAEDLAAEVPHSEVGPAAVESCLAPALDSDPVATDAEANSPVEDAELPLQPVDEGSGAFAHAEEAIAAELGTEAPVAPAEPEPLDHDPVVEPSVQQEPVGSEPVVAEVPASDDDLAIELGVGVAEDASTPVEGELAVQEPVDASVTTSEEGALEPSGLTVEADGLDTENTVVEDVVPEETPAEHPEAALDEPSVEIPRPEEANPRQGSLFGLKRGDDPLVAEAIDLIQQSGRASASFLQRKLRIDFGTATQLLQILAERGVVELDADQSQGRLLR